MKYFGLGGGENEVHRLGLPRKRCAPHITEQDGSQPLPKSQCPSDSKPFLTFKNIPHIPHSSHSTVSSFSLLKVGPRDHAAHETVPRSRVRFKGVLQRTESLIFIMRNSKFALGAISQGMASHPFCLPSTSGLAPLGHLR